ncbi:hypothetical protein JAAARDRAFT_203757 [Jaapia argillacea MUCL 33604]|uniref:Acyl-CoA thioesterase-like N-terminal HotDog domain-containing protein n=1 Tax=Jaapia argillacea MUCL 33604 TaxID=933084 RepID=A0A067QJ76_9AGAM|nr:hypothetical protein JAAARDRAFT_203757 [Jaapia argillacea MUCL 33604]
MPPLSKSLTTTLISPPRDGTSTYKGTIDKDWNIASVPNGGYVLGLIIQSSITHQKHTPHPTPLHITAHYLRPTSPTTPFCIRVRTLRVGRSVSNIVAELSQSDETKIISHLIFTSPSPSPTSSLTPTPISSLTSKLTPPSPYARRIPLHSHPSLSPPTPIPKSWNFAAHISLAEDRSLISASLHKATARGEARVGEVRGGDGLEWAAWFELVGEGECITNASIAFLVDTFKNLPELLPKDQRKGLGPSWFPTLTLSLEYKSPFPFPSPTHSSRTVGLYSSGRFLNEPHGQHDAYVEVWSAPSDIGKGREEKGWREEQVCLAVSHQVALVVPMEVNQRNGVEAKL